MNFSNDTDKKPFISLQFFLFFFFDCVFNLVPIALIALEAAIREGNFFKVRFPEN